MQNHYEVLGVSPNATEADIKQAYRTLAMKYHPDKTKGDKAAESRFHEVSEAAEVLRDPRKRREHDANLADVRRGVRSGAGHQANQGGGSPFDFMFGGGAGGFDNFFRSAGAFRQAASGFTRSPPRDFGWKSGENVTTFTLQGIVDKMTYTSDFDTEGANVLMRAVKEGLRKNPEVILSFDTAKEVGTKLSKYSASQVKDLLIKIELKKATYFDPKTMGPSEVKTLIDEIVKHANHTVNKNLDTVDACVFTGRAQRVKLAKILDRCDGIAEKVDLTEMFLKTRGTTCSETTMELYADWMMKASVEDRKSSLSRVMDYAKDNQIIANDSSQKIDLYRLVKNVGDKDPSIYREVNLFPLATRCYNNEDRKSVVRDVLAANTDMTKVAKHLSELFLVEKDGKKQFDSAAYTNMATTISYVDGQRPIKWHDALSAQTLADHDVSDHFLEKWVASAKAGLMPQDIKPFVDVLCSYPNQRTMPDGPNRCLDVFNCVRSSADKLAVLVRACPVAIRHIDFNEIPSHIYKHSSVQALAKMPGAVQRRNAISCLGAKLGVFGR